VSEGFTIGDGRALHRLRFNTEDHHGVALA
jgi:hypothetical protein